MTMLQYSLNELLLALLMSFRFGAMFASMPFFSEIRTPLLMAVVLPMVLGFLLAPVTPQILPPGLFSSPILLGLAIITEILVGTLIGYSVRVVMGLASVAGEIAGIQIGFSMAAIFDPHFGQVSEVAYFNLIFVTIAFFVFDVHHSLFRTLAYSYVAVPVGTPFISMSAAAAGIGKLFTLVFAMGCRFAFPVVVAILMSHIINGLISVTAPQLNIYFNAAMALNIGLGLAIMAMSFGNLFVSLRTALTQMQGFFDGFFGVMR